MIKFLLEIIITSPIVIFRYLRSPKETTYRQFLKKDDSTHPLNYLYGLILWSAIFGGYYYVRENGFPQLF